MPLPTVTSPRRPARTRRRHLLTTAVAAAALGLPATALLPAAQASSPGHLGSSARPSSPAATPAATPAGLGARDVIANLWEWNWTSVAAECTNHLGPDGYGGVQVAPPQDSLKRTDLLPDTQIRHPWWEVYQPTDYGLTSRMGGQRQFRTMVSTCRRAGVKVYVDAVINHMADQTAGSYGGVSYEKYAYPGIYGESDFHVPHGDCPSASGNIDDFNNKRQVFNCNLVSLPDLRTGTGKVRDRLAAYLNTLLRYGVSGFRVDAGKHINPRDLDAIRARLHRTVDGTAPYWALEVFGGGPGILSPQSFTEHGDVLGLDGVKQLKAAFKSYPTDATGSIATLRTFGFRSGLTKGSQTLSFVQNHDTERNGDALNYKDGATNTLATQWLLASGYGTPQVYSSFEWDVSDASPPADTEGMITDTDCATGWACVNRDPGVVALVGWHNHVGHVQRRNWWDDGENVVAFSRRDRGWAAFNNGTAAKTIRVQTGMRAGRYCDAVSGGAGGCAGTTVTVGTRGFVRVSVPAKGVVAFDRTDRR